jgi:hypothetical protein
LFLLDLSLGLRNIRTRLAKHINITRRLDMLNPEMNEARKGKGVWLLRGCLIMTAVFLLCSACQKSEAPPAAGTAAKAAAAPQKDASAPDSNELNYDKAMAKQYADGAPINVTGKVTQTVDEKSILMATRKDDVFGYLDNIVTITFPEKPSLGVGDIVQVKAKNAGIKKYTTEGKGQYDAPFLKGETFDVLEKGKPAK